MKIAGTIILFFLYCFVMNAKCLAENSVDTNSINIVVAGNNNFALDLYGKLKDDSKGNLFFSPYSISTSLAIIYGGAADETKKQMTKTLHFTVPDEKFYPAFGELQKQLIQSEKTPGCQLLLANALWLQKGEPFEKDFLDLTVAFDAGRFQLDFVMEAEKSRQKINSWIKEQTKNKIRDMIPHNGITGETRLVITNSVYFIDEWKNKFDVAETRGADFYVTAEKKVNARLMHLNESFKY